MFPQVYQSISSCLIAIYNHSTLVESFAVKSRHTSRRHTLLTTIQRGRRQEGQWSTAEYCVSPNIWSCRMSTRRRYSLAYRHPIVARQSLFTNDQMMPRMLSLRHNPSKSQNLEVINEEWRQKPCGRLLCWEGWCNRPLLDCSVMIWRDVRWRGGRSYHSERTGIVNLRSCILYSKLKAKSCIRYH